MHPFDIDDLCSLLEGDIIELAVVVAFKVSPHSLIRVKAFMIFACLMILTAEAIPDVAVAIWSS